MAMHRFDLGAESPVEVRVEPGEGAVTIESGGSTSSVGVIDRLGGGASLRIADAEASDASRIERVHAVDEGEAVTVWWRGRTWRLPVVERRARRAGDAAAGAAGDEIAAPMPGTVLAVKVAVGDTISKDDVVLVMESMKMEMSLPAERDATIAEVLVSDGDMVDLGQSLVRFAPATAEDDPAGTSADARGAAGG